MTVNIVMLYRNRYELTRQALRSLKQHTDPVLFNLTLVDDASEWEGDLFHERWTVDDHPANMALCRVMPSKHVIGFVRNLGVWFAEHYWGRGDYLYLSDNDAYFTEGWLDRLLASAEALKRMRFGASSISSVPVSYFVLAAYNHPFHVAVSQFAGMKRHDTLGSFSMLMPWLTWDSCGPFSQDFPQTPQHSQCEDVLFCERVKAVGGVLAALHPPVVLNCGLTSTNGEDCTRRDLVEKEKVEGVEYR